MNRIRAYAKTMRAYLQTPKGYRDATDYAAALATILLTTAILILIIYTVQTNIRY